MLYATQNNLQYVAVTNLEAATFQILYQSKILTTALCAVMFLGKRLTMMQLFSLLLLTAGVVCASLPPANTSPAAAEVDRKHHDQNHLIGVAAVSTACLTSGFAGIYTESMLKKTRRAEHTSAERPSETFSSMFWYRNLQMSLGSLFFAAIAVLFIDRNSILQTGFWHGYNITVCTIILLQAIGGITVAAALTLTDNILKGFATSMSVILSTAASAILWGLALSSLFLVGLVLVLTATSIYVLGDVKSKRSYTGVGAKHEDSSWICDKSDHSQILKSEDSRQSTLLSDRATP